MGPKDTTVRVSAMFRQPLIQLIDPKHGLVRLAAVMDWDSIEVTFAAHFESRTGCPALPRMEATKRGVRNNLLRDHRGAMNSFTHTNWLQMARRLTVTALEPNYEPSEIVSTLDFSSAVA